MQCKFCYVTFFNKKTDDLSIEIVQRAANLGFSVITFTGGDPFSKPKFRDACIEAKKLGMQTHVDTNALAIKKSDLVFIENYIDLLGISIDGVGDTHNELRESTKSFDKIEKLLPLVTNTNTKIKINTILTKKNLNCLYELSSFIDKYSNISIWSIYQFFPLDAAQKYYDQFFIDIEGFEKQTSLLKLKNETKIELFPFSKRVNGYLFVNELGQMFTNSIKGDYIYLDSIFKIEMDTIESKLTDFINPRTKHRYKNTTANNVYSA